MAHELGHIHNRDILIGTVAAIMMLAKIAQVVCYPRWHTRPKKRQRGKPLSILAIVAPLATMLLQAAVSRTREFKADKYGTQYSGNPLYLANALKN